MNLPLRKDVKQEDMWDLSSLYKNEKTWDQACEQAAPATTQPLWPTLQQFQGKLHDLKALQKLFEELYKIDRELTKLYTWAHLVHDQDITHEENKKRLAKVMHLHNQFREETAWIDPEILALPEKTFKEALSSPLLEAYRFTLEKLHNLKPHTLSKREEELLSYSMRPLRSTAQAFSALNNADLQFENALDSSGKQHILTHGSYGVYIRSKDKVLRESAFTNLHGSFASHQNTIAELLQGVIEAHWFQARARGFSSCLEAALKPHQIPVKVYHTLIETVQKELKPLHRYTALKQKVLKLKPFHLFDQYVPLIDVKEEKISYTEAEKLVIEGVSNLGETYRKALEEGLTKARWVDRYENKNKRSGAYSSGCFDSHPYILMNYKETLRDVMTLAHEAGHSMHSFLSHKNQPYHLADYPIFVAEVASTLNEELLFNTLLQKHKNDPKMQAYLINQKLEDFRATFYRQTLFAEFELWLHEKVEQGLSLVPSELNAHYAALNKKYYGDQVEVDCHGECEWARIPHFYGNFYVYQYATGISASFALAQRILNGAKGSQEAVLNFLSSGGSRPPIELLQKAGVNMLEGSVIREACHHFDALVSQLEELLL